MPRKTKKEKIIAASRRQQLQLVHTQPEPIQREKPVPVKMEEPESDKNNFFFPDLKKSLMLSAIVITLEIALYFARIVR